MVGVSTAARLLPQCTFRWGQLLPQNLRRGPNKLFVALTNRGPNKLFVGATAPTEMYTEVKVLLRLKLQPSDYPYHGLSSKPSLSA